MSKIVIKVEVGSSNVDKDALQASVQNLLINKNIKIISIKASETPSIGDFGIFWDSDDKSEAVINVLDAIDSAEDCKYPYQIKNGTWYENFTPFVSEEHFKEFIKDE